LLYSEKDVYLSNSTIVNGAITARRIQMNNSSQIIATDNHCFKPSDNYEVTLSPATQYALMCGTEQPSFEIETKNDGYAESTGVTVQVYPDADKFSVEVADSTGTGTYPSFTTSNVSSKLGKLKLQVTVTDQNGIELNDEYTLKVTVDNDPSKTQTSTFKFVPFKFDIDDQAIVAGKNYQI
ncbi:MSHA biogenesis protein MshQ, partial [Vibrio parahaemolyticus]|nr:MSHA biogenesis protein MshQ [Vibrio parahaemolyticus]